MNAKLHLRALDHFIFRVPFLPLNPLSDAVFNGDAIHDNKILEALMIASYDLSEQLSIVKENKNFLDTKEFISFLKYYSRMCTRCTPFGLFASMSTGTLSNNTHFEIPDALIRKTRLDMYFVCMIIQYISSDNEFKKKLKYFPNNTIYAAGDSSRYIMFEYKVGRRCHSISEFEKDEDLNILLEKMNDGLLYDDIISILQSLDFNKVEAVNYIESLIVNQVIVNELNPSVVGEDNFEKVISVISKFSLSSKNSIFRDHLVSISNLLKNIDTTSAVEERINLYQQIVLSSSLLNIPFNKSQLIQVDTSRYGNGVTVSYGVVKQIKKAINFLLNFHEKSVPGELLKFRNEFYNKYESAEIPLSIALDADIGIGYPPQHGNANISPIIDGLHLYSSEVSNGSISINKYQATVLRKMLEINGDLSKEVILSDDDFDQNTLEFSDFRTISVWFQLLDSTDGHERVFIKAIDANNSGKLLSRFAHLNDDICNLVFDLTKAEEIDGKIAAEVVHLPSSRVGNILSRPHIGDYEIVYISDSDIPSSNKIEVSDIMVSVKMDRLCLRSKKLNKEIIPKLTSAHNYKLDTLPVYKFLCDMQYSSGANFFGYNTDSLLGMLAFTPRVVYENMIISLARWVVAVADIVQFVTLPPDNLLASISEWRTLHKIPTCVTLQSGDNELFVNFSNIYSIKAFLSTIKNQKNVVLSEFLFPTDRDDKYANECLMAFKVAKI